MPTRRGPVAAALAVMLLAGCGVGGPSAHQAESSAPSTPPTTSTSVVTSPSACSGVDLSGWTLAQLAHQVLVAPVDMSDLAAARDLVRSGAGGLLLYGSAAPADLGDQLAQLEAGASGVPPFVMTDEEGGAVQRMLTLVGPVPSARHMGAVLSADRIERLARRVGRRLAAAGVTMDLAPVLDLDDGPGPSATDADGTRSFGLDPDEVSADGLAFARGLETAGVVPVVKHFPGLGSTKGNTDLGPAATLPWTELQRVGVRPFEAAVQAGIPAVMVANASVPGLTSEPASLSPEVVTSVLRDQLGFTGLVLTDSLSAGAVRDAGYPVPRATVAALSAGADLILYGSGDDVRPALTRRAARAVVAAVRSGTLSRTRLLEAAASVLTAKGLTVCGAT